MIYVIMYLCYSVQVPPGSGIVHQVNLEYLARVCFTDAEVLYPDSVVGTRHNNLILHMHVHIKLLHHLYLQRH